MRLTPPAYIDTPRAHDEGEKIPPVSTVALILLVAGVLTAAAGVALMVVGGRGGSGPAPAGPTDWAGTAPGRPTRPGLVVGALLATLGVVLAGTGTVGLVTQSGRQSEDVVAAGDRGDFPSDPGWSTAPSETSTATGEASDSRGDAGPGTNCGMVLPAHGGPAQLQVKSGYIDCAEAERVVQKYYDLPPDPNGGNTAPQEFEGWRCATATYGTASSRGYGTSCVRDDVELIVLNPETSRDGSDSPGSDVRGSGDLGLSTPITRPSCDGRGIVVLFSAVTPGAYESEIRTALAENPGSKYLRTDQSCPSLRPRDDNGNVIYAVYRESGYTRAQVCADVASAPDGAYGRWLDMTSDPSELVTC